MRRERPRMSLEVMREVGTIAPWLVARFAGGNFICPDASVVRVDIVDIDIEPPIAQGLRAWLLPREDDAIAVLEDRHYRLPRRPRSMLRSVRSNTRGSHSEAASRSA
jgi:hypothetical protein